MLWFSPFDTDPVPIKINEINKVTKQGKRKQRSQLNWTWLKGKGNNLANLHAMIILSQLCYCCCSRRHRFK
jgi:hypothetical protein